MSVAATSAGGHSTLDVLIGAVVVIWALAGAGLVLGWVWRHAVKGGIRRRRATQSDGLAGAQTTAPAAAANPRPEPAAPPQPSAADPPSASAQAHAPSVPPPAIPGARLSPEQLEPLGQDMDNARRLAACEARVAPVLEALPADRWLVERYVLLAGHRIPFLILGETGVFVLWAIPGLPQWRELAFPDEIARRVERDLPGYGGEVQPGVCQTSKPDMQPRWWCRPGEPGAWVMGPDWLIPWLEHFGPANGLGVKDIERLRELAGPRWGHPVNKDVPLSAHIPTIN
jgi:hypothetical protein